MATSAHALDGEDEDALFKLTNDMMIAMVVFPDPNTGLAVGSDDDDDVLVLQQRSTTDRTDASSIPPRAVDAIYRVESGVFKSADVHTFQHSSAGP